MKWLNLSNLAAANQDLSIRSFVGFPYGLNKYDKFININNFRAIFFGN